MSINHVENREKLINFITTDFVGPLTLNNDLKFHKINTSEEIIFENKEEINKLFCDEITGEEILHMYDPGFNPLKQYSAGILYPPGATIDENSESDEFEDSQSLLDMNIATEINDKFEENLRSRVEKNPSKYSAKDQNIDSELEINAVNERKPNAIALSFYFKFTEKTKIEFTFSGGIYQSLKAYENSSGVKKPFRNFFLRNKYVDKLEVDPSLIKKVKERGYVPLNEQDRVKNFLGVTVKYSLYIRKYNKGFIGTIVYENITTGYSKESLSSLFQAEINVNITEEGNSNILPYPSERKFNNKSYIDMENKKFEMLYREHPTYAIGHGVSVNWGEDLQIYSQTIPLVKLKKTTPEILNTSTDNNFDISMNELANGTGYKVLKELLDQYENWINQQKNQAQEIDPFFEDVAIESLSECRTALERMRDGLKLIQTNEEVKKAFELANLAMYQQQRRPSDPENIRRMVKFEKNSSKTREFDKDVVEKDIVPKWRPFQIAFILLNLESIFNEESVYRENVELLWFPTGGGKTEAYLGLSAFTLFLRRIQNKTDNSTGIIMRYTLRLLTAQQFDRSSRLICAMEKIRQENSELLGLNPFTIGIWVGRDTTPNTRGTPNSSGTAQGNLAELKDFKKYPYAKSLYIIQSCPWCGAEIGRNKKFSTVLGIKSTTKSTQLHCPDPKCHFFNNLPIKVTDEDIYEEPVSFLIATVDKFSRFPWRNSARSIFGYDKNGIQTGKPPSLIIQDELHLITNALGSAVGFFETIVDYFCLNNKDGLKIKPKIICSTATIRNSKKQLLGLYARENSKIFPPTSISIDDSYFSKIDNKSEGKVYLGIFTPGTPTQQTQTNVYSATSQALSFFKDLESKDPWYTNLCYFGSMRELGTTYSLLSENMVRKLNQLHEKYQLDYQEKEKVYRPNDWEVMELTSRIDSADVVSTMNQLNLSLDKNKKSEVTQFVLATSIIEVGIDIQRLSLMILLNQPKNTSQYIQSTGRIGRDSKKPGLVITIFSPFRARDRSHYEKFTSYHNALHSTVEPTSVTPFSDAAVKRMLHGAFFMFLSCKLPSIYFKGSTFEFPESAFEEFKNLMKERNSLILKDTKSSNDIDEYLEDIPKKWRSIQANRYADEFDNKIEERPLIMQAGSWRRQREESFLMPDSMRSVDQTAKGVIIKAPSPTTEEEEINE